MTDKELLKAAARAAGYTLEPHHDANGAYWPWCIELANHWCPLTDDGDALRLSVRLGIDVQHFKESERVEAWINPWDAREEDYKSDPYAATRHAIVRAAAAIGSLHNAGDKQ